jgi:hypothetical protein
MSVNGDEPMFYKFCIGRIDGYWFYLHKPLLREWFVEDFIVLNHDRLLELWHDARQIDHRYGLLKVEWIEDDDRASVYPSELRIDGFTQRLPVPQHHHCHELHAVRVRLRRFAVNVVQRDERGHDRSVSRWVGDSARQLEQELESWTG